MAEWVTITGILTAEGEIIVDLPEGWVPGDCWIEITLKEGYLPPPKKESDEPTPFDDDDNDKK